MQVTIAGLHCKIVAAGFGKSSAALADANTAFSPGRPINTPMSAAAAIKRDARTFRRAPGSQADKLRNDVSDEARHATELKKPAHELRAGFSF